MRPYFFCEGAAQRINKHYLRMQGRIQDFFRRGALVSCSTSTLTNKPHCFFLQNTSCIRKPQVISGGGGAHPLHPPPRSAPGMRWINPISVIIASSDIIEESLFDNNSKCEDCECTVVKVFLTVTKRCRRCRAMNIPSFERKKAKKNLRGKGGRKVNPRTYKGEGESQPPWRFSKVFPRRSNISPWRFQ